MKFIQGGIRMTLTSTPRRGLACLAVGGVPLAPDAQREQRRAGGGPRLQPHQRCGCPLAIIALQFGACALTPGGCRSVHRGAAGGHARLRRHLLDLPGL
jgi:hypothetical protein